jgi:hypothetical protein
MDDKVWGNLAVAPWQVESSFEGGLGAEGSVEGYGGEVDGAGETYAEQLGECRFAVDGDAVGAEDCAEQFEIGGNWTFELKDSLLKL